MKRTYSLYEAKAKLSEIIREVRERRVAVIVSYHGRPVAEIRPIDEPADEDPLAARIRELEASGQLIRGKGGNPLDMKGSARRPGGLKRFLEDR